MSCKGAKRRDDLEHLINGCACSACYGFKEAIERITGHEHPGQPAPGCGAARAETPNVFVVACDGSMTCSCSRCCADRQARTRLRPARQPWEVRGSGVSAWLPAECSDCQIDWPQAFDTMVAEVLVAVLRQLHSSVLNAEPIDENHARFEMVCIEYEEALLASFVLASDDVARGDLFAEATARGATVLVRPVDPWAAIGRAERVYAAGGEIAFLALLAGRVVHCFDEFVLLRLGVTTDDPRVPRRPFRRTVDEVFAGACLVATRYLDPYRRTASSFEDMLSILADWRKIETANRQSRYCVGMSFWKRRPSCRVLSVDSRHAGISPHQKRALARGGRRPAGHIAVWASRDPRRGSPKRPRSKGSR